MTQHTSELPIDPNTGLDPVGGFDFAGRALQRAQNATVNLTHTFTPRLVGEFKLSYSRIAINSLAANSGAEAGQKLGIPNIYFNFMTSQMPYVGLSNYQSLGDSGWIPLVTYNNVYQPAANMFYATGAHAIKFGGDIRARQVNAYQSAHGVPIYVFDQFLTSDPSTGLGGNSLATLLTGYPMYTNRSLYLVSIPGYRMKEYATFIQDDWRVTPWLTLNLGLRYEYFSPISEAFDRLSNFDPVAAKVVIAGQDGVSSSAGVKGDKNNFAPRVGFAATFRRNWVLRGGYGISYNPAVMGSNMALRNAPFSSTYSVSTATPGPPANRLSDGLPLPIGDSITDLSGTLNAVAFKGPMPYVHSYNVSLQRQLPLNLVATASYVGVLGRNLYDPNSNVPLNDPAPGPGDYQTRRPYYSRLPNMQSIAYYGPSYESEYHALQVTLERRFSKGFGILANYTWSHATDTDDPRMREDNSLYFVNGTSASDIRQRLSVTTNYQPPLGKNVLGRNWQVSAILILQSGFGMTIGNAVTSLNGFGPSRANAIGDPNLSRSERTMERWFNTSAFSAPPNYVYGTASRGQLQGPGKFYFDASVRREFTLIERLKLQFRGEAFNLTNTPPLGNPDGSFGSSTFGQILGAGDGRRVQFALKAVF